MNRISIRPKTSEVPIRFVVPLHDGDRLPGGLRLAWLRVAPVNPSGQRRYLSEGGIASTEAVKEYTQRHGSWPLSGRCERLGRVEESKILPWNRGTAGT